MSTANAEFTRLHDAAKKGEYSRVVKWVNYREHYVWVRTEDGWLPIHHAARWGGSHVVRFFVTYANEHREQGDMVNEQTFSGITPLSLAAEVGDHKSVELLVNEGKANVWTRRQDGRLPIHYAARYGRTDALRFFLKYGGTHFEEGDMVNDRDKNGDTPLSLAVQGRHFECVRLLLQTGADVSIANEQGETPGDIAEKANSAPQESNNSWENLIRIGLRSALGVETPSREISSILSRELTVTDKYNVDNAELLGSGSYGSVTTAVHKVTEVKFAIKTTRPSFIEEKVLREIEVMQKLKHRNVVTLFDHFVTKRQKTSITLIMELCDESLYDWLGRHPYEERRHEDVKRMLAELSNGLAYVHEKRVIHRDLHPRNVLIKVVNGERILKITDFGLSIAVNTGETSHTDRVGCQLYRAPEMSPPDEYKRVRYDYKVDVYAEGLIFYEILANFEFTERVQHLKWAIGSFFVKNFGRDFPDEMKLIIRMLSEEPENRPTSTEVSQKAEGWLKKAKMKYLNENLNDFYDAFEALHHKLQNKVANEDGVDKMCQKIVEWKRIIDEWSSEVDS